MRPGPGRRPRFTEHGTNLGHNTSIYPQVSLTIFKCMTFMSI